jgi:hypothetical protein
MGQRDQFVMMAAGMIDASVMVTAALKIRTAWGARGDQLVMAAGMINASVTVTKAPKMRM